MIGSCRREGRSTRVRSTMAFAVIGVLAFAALNPRPGFSQAPPAGPPPSVAAWTQSLVALARSYHDADAGEQAALLGQMITLATERQESLSALAEDDPGAVLSLAIPAAVKEVFPDAVQSLIEERRSVEGSFVVGYEDGEEESHLFHLLEARDERIALHFAANPPQLDTGTQVSVSGVDLGGTMVVGSGDSDVQILATGGWVSSGEPDPISDPIDNALGYQPALVMLVNFQDQPEQPWTVADVESAFFGELNSFIYENSYGQAWVGGDIYGWYTIPFDSTVCSMMDIEAAARSAAEAAGAVLSDYRHHFYVFPNTGNCPFAGASVIGGDPSRIWINGYLQLDVIAHEFGHGLGIYHGHSWACEGETLGSTCTKLEYGDGLDVMGWSKAAHYNAFNKERLRWLNTAESAPIEIASTSGTFTIDALADATGKQNPRALKVYKGIDPATGREVWYYIEFRQAIGFDGIIQSDLMDAGNVLTGLVIRTASPNQSGNTGYLLDMTPETYQLYTKDPALPVGRTYVDEAAGVTLTTLWAEGNSAGVQVGLDTQGTPACLEADPSLSLSPAEGQWVVAGTPVSYSVEVTNNSSSACADANFDLSATVPAGWTAVFAEANLLLTPGTNGITTVTVSSASNAADGFYDVTVAAVSGTSSDSGNVTYVVDNGSSNTPPHAIDDVLGLVLVQPATIDVLANDWDAENDTITIDRVSNGSRGSVQINADGTVTYTPGNAFKNRDRFTYTISDGSASATAMVSVETTSRGRGGGRKNQ